MNEKVLKQSLIYAIVLLNIVFAQDIHFSQYNGSPLNLSPGLCGFFDGDYRFNAAFRKQWVAVPVPYTTVSMSAEGKYKLKKTTDVLAYGLLFNNDKAGDAIYTLNQLYLFGAYQTKLSSDSTLLMSIGLSTGYVNNAFNYARMTFDSQFDGLQYNANAATNENFSRTSLHYFDFNLGTAFKYIVNQKMDFTYALSFNHFTNPVITYYANTSSKLDTKIINYLNAKIPIQRNLFILPELYIAFQGKYKEIIPGAQLSYWADPLNDIYVRGGLYFRTQDAFIVRAGLDYQNTFFGMSYDVNISRFTPATNNRGGFEMYVIHVLRTAKTYLNKKKPCPVFL